MEKIENGEVIQIHPFFPANIQTIHTKHNIRVKIMECFTNILSLYDVFTQLGSGFTLKRVVNLTVSIARFRIFYGGNGSPKLPPRLAYNKSCVGAPNIDNKCFLYAVLMSIYKIQSYPNKKQMLFLNSKICELNCTKLQFPIGLKDVAHFERKNNISINVFGYREVIYPLYMTSDKTKAHHVNLLLYDNHFFYVRLLNPLLNVNGLNISKSKWVCNYCLCHFSKKSILDQHILGCPTNKKILSFPDDKSYICFQNFKNQIPTPFVIYCDFESSIAQPKSGERKVISESTHKAISFSAKRLCYTNKEYNGKLVSYVGQNTMEMFISYLESEHSKIDTILTQSIKPLRWKKNELHMFKQRTQCDLCGHKQKTLNADHDHLTGNFRYALCDGCNLNRASVKYYKIPVLIHNGSGYDFHYIVQSVHKMMYTKVTVIPKSTQQYLSLYVGPFHFIDTNKFLIGSLSTLVNNLKEKGIENFKYTSAYFGKENVDIMCQKNVFCYDYITHIDVLNDTKLPQIHHFFNSLTNKSISEHEYEQACMVWRRFKCKRLADYMLIYQKADVLLLCDVFEYYRAMCIDFYGLDPTCYLSLSQYSNDAFLKMSKVKLEMISDPDIYFMLMKMIRGGYAVCNHKYARANNNLMRDYDSNEPTSYLTMVDYNSLYPHIMSHPLPYKSFRLLSKREVDNFDIDLLNSNGKTGYILEVDCIYPRGLHAMHHDFPLAPYRKIMDKSVLSPYNRLICELNNHTYVNKCPKLIADFTVEKKYVLHYKTLALYLKHGLKLKKIHRILQFRQKPFMKSFIEFNSARRSEATNRFDQNLFKNCSNMCFGKQIENVCNRMNVRLVKDKEVFLKYSARPNFKSFNIINKDLVSVNMARERVFLNRPIYIGAAILDLSKAKMYKFHYETMIPKFGRKNLRILYSDTDSFLYHIFTNDLYREFQSMGDIFDFSNFPPEHFLYSEKRKREHGFMKEENASVPITEFIGLRSKMYFYKTDHKQHNTGKGIAYSALQRLKRKHYLKTLMSGIGNEVSFRSIRSNNHRLFTLHANKRALGVLDDKRYVLKDGVHSLPYGYYAKRKWIADNMNCDDQHQFKRLKQMVPYTLLRNHSSTS
jgi:hypothetical protein